MPWFGWVAIGVFVTQVALAFWCEWYCQKEIERLRDDVLAPPLYPARRP
jgi:hypothetical protein